MRVVHLSTLHPPLDVRIFEKECRTLAADGHDVHLIVSDPPTTSRDGVSFHPFPKPLHRFRPGRIGHRLARMYRLAARLRADVYHFHDPELITVGLLLKARGAKVIYDVHEESVTEALVLNRDRPLNGRFKATAWMMLESLARRCFDAFVAATPTIARHFPSEHTYVVRNFPRLAEFLSAPESQVPYRDRPPQVMYAGAITLIRGIREMIATLTHVPETSRVRLTLVGKFFSSPLEAEMQRTPGWAQVDYHGVQPYEVVRELLGKARIGLAVLHPEPGLPESLPIKLFEYMAAGLPVIASHFPLWKQMIDDAKCGITVDPRDPEQIAVAIQHLLSHPEEAEAMGLRGREAVRQHYNWEVESSRLLELYQRLSAA